MNSYVNKVCSISSEEKKVCVVTHQIEYEVGNVSDVADQKGSVSLGVAKKTRPQCVTQKGHRNTLRVLLVVSEATLQGQG